LAFLPHFWYTIKNYISDWMTMRFLTRGIVLTCAVSLWLSINQTAGHFMTMGILPTPIAAAPEQLFAPIDAKQIGVMAKKLQKRWVWDQHIKKMLFVGIWGVQLTPILSSIFSALFLSPRAYPQPLDNIASSPSASASPRSWLGLLGGSLLYAMRYIVVPSMLHIVTSLVVKNIQKRLSTSRAEGYMVQVVPYHKHAKDLLLQLQEFARTETFAMSIAFPYEVNGGIKGTSAIQQDKCAMMSTEECLMPGTVFYEERRSLLKSNVQALIDDAYNILIFVACIKKNALSSYNDSLNHVHVALLDHINNTFIPKMNELCAQEELDVNLLRQSVQKCIEAINNAVLRVKDIDAALAVIHA
jgi:hypothetical protein